MDLLAKKQMETEGRLEQILQSTAAQQTRITELSKEVQDLEKKVLGLEAGSTSLKSEIQAIYGKVSTSQPAPAPSTIEVVSSEPAKPDNESVQQEAYMKAFGIFSANRYSEAIEAFTAFIDTYPGSEYAANAQYWIGECFYSQKDYQKALAAFSAVPAKYPKGKKVPDAMLKVSFSQLSLNDHSSAKATMQKLIEAYPKSPAAAKAKERLNRF